jgi:hypothetical protein
VKSVRTKDKPFADVRVGYASTICTSIGNQALYAESVLKIPALPGA